MEGDELAIPGPESECACGRSTSHYCSLESFADEAHSVVILE
jgi:hypothetical protein